MASSLGRCAGNRNSSAYAPPRIERSKPHGRRCSGEVHAHDMAPGRRVVSIPATRCQSGPTRSAPEQRVVAARPARRAVAGAPDQPVAVAATERQPRPAGRVRPARRSSSSARPSRFARRADTISDHDAWRRARSSLLQPALRALEASSPFTEPPPRSASGLHPVPRAAPAAASRSAPRVRRPSGRSSPSRTAAAGCCRSPGQAPGAPSSD